MLVQNHHNSIANFFHGHRNLFGHIQQELQHCPLAELPLLAHVLNATVRSSADGVWYVHDTGSNLVARRGLIVQIGTPLGSSRPPTLLGKHALEGTLKIMGPVAGRTHRRETRGPPQMSPQCRHTKTQCFPDLAAK